MAEPVRSLFDTEEFKPLSDRWHARQAEFAKRWSYFDGTVYDKVLWIAEGISAPLARGIRPLYLPCARAVHVDAGIVPGYWRLAPAAEALAPAVAKEFAMSRWDTQGVLFVHYGAMLGNSGLRVSYMTDVKRVIISPLDPSCFMLVRSDAYARGADYAIVADVRQDAAGNDYEYAEVMSASDVRTFRNGVPWSYDGRPPVYAHELGDVPIVECQHLNVGKAIGDCAFSKAMLLLDSVNELASDLRGVIRAYRDPAMALIGIDDTEDETGSAKPFEPRRDKAWYLPLGGDAKFLVPNLNIAGTLAFIQDTRDQVEKSMPELAFDELTRTNAIATATVELQLLELVLTIKRVRPNYDAAFVAALRLAGRAALALGLPEIAVLDSDELAFDVERPVLPLTDVTQTQIDK